MFVPRSRHNLLSYGTCHAATNAGDGVRMLLLGVQLPRRALSSHRRGIAIQGSVTVARDRDHRKRDTYPLAVRFGSGTRSNDYV